MQRAHVPAKVWWPDDADLATIRGAAVAVIGYGSQGRAQALNLRDSGVRTTVGTRPGPSRARAVSDGFPAADVADAVRSADVIAVLVSDEQQGAVVSEQILPHARPGTPLLYAHGFAVHFGQVATTPANPALLVAPKGPGNLVRDKYLAGDGVPCLWSVQGPSPERARAIALSYALAIGCLRSGGIETTFQEEAETDLFGEQAVLCGGMSELVRAGFETLVGAGYRPEVAYFECLYELKQVVDLMYERGLAGMNREISSTARYGALTRGTQVIDERVREAMRSVLADIVDGSFAREWVAEDRAGRPSFAAQDVREATDCLETTGSAIRALYAASGRRTGSRTRAGRRQDGAYGNGDRDAAASGRSPALRSGEHDG